MDNNGIPNGCGMPNVARFYYISFQIIVSQVFLNLFIAIVVDTFVAMKQEHDLPVTQMDVDTFVEIWGKYDSFGTSYINWRELEDFLIELHLSDTSFFEGQTQVFSDSLMRRDLMIFLEFPMHQNLKKVFFHDVLLLCCRNVVECSHKLF